MSGSKKIADVYLESRPLLKRFLRARVEHAEDVEELLQDLWIKLENKKPGEIKSPVAYLCRMAENAIRDRYRSKISEKNRERQWVDKNVGKVTSISQYADPGPERELISRQELTLVERALGELPERTEYVFRSFRVEKRRQQELADELDISLSAIEKHLQRAYRAIAAVRQSLDAENEDGNVL